LLNTALQPKTSTGAQTALISVAFVLFFVSLVLVSIGISVLGLGHGHYTSEMGETSAWYPQGKYVNDQAYQDPIANTRLLRREYEQMVRAAAAYYGPGGPRGTVDPAAAERAIYEVTHADTSARVSAVLNADAGGTTYMSILERQRGIRPGQTAWFEAGSETRGVDVGPFSEQTQARVRARGERPDEKFQYVKTATWTWGYNR
jgi:hypothetical protein